MEGDVSERYRYEYKLTKRFGHWTHIYLVVGRWGAVSLHITDYGEKRHSLMTMRYAGGLEVHYRQPPEYMRDSPPSHERCWAFDHGSPCWHDGTSLYVEEVLLPMWERNQQNHEFMFAQLESELFSRIEKDGCAVSEYSVPGFVPKASKTSEKEASQSE